MKKKIDPRQLMLSLEFPPIPTSTNEQCIVIDKCNNTKATILNFRSFVRIDEETQQSYEINKLLSAAQKLNW